MFECAEVLVLIKAYVGVGDVLLRRIWLLTSLRFECLISVVIVDVVVVAVV